MDGTGKVQRGGDVITSIGRSYLRLQLVPEVGPLRLARLISYFGSPDAVWEASESQLKHVEGIGEKIAATIAGSRSEDAMEREIARAAEVGVRIRCLADEEYPAQLRQIPDPPTCLYMRGTLIPEDAVAIAIVGTRQCSVYGSEQAYRFGELLAQAGFTIVSGMARGIDAEAHRAALRAGGRTIGVLGSGLSNIYPPEHRDLANALLDRGALVSELPIDTSPEARNFPPRNRIIVGLSMGVLVVEAGVRSGALISARLAHEYNREVFAIPGRVDSPATTAGTNGLIRDGQAKLVTCLEDILNELGEVGAIMKPGRTAGASSDAAPPKPASHLSPAEDAILSALSDEAMDIDSLVERAGVPLPSASASLMTLQLKGLIQQLPGQRYRKRSATEAARGG